MAYRQIGVLAGLLSSTAAFAQPEPATQQTARSDEENIVVTAQRRAQALQDVSLAVTAVDGERLQDAVQWTQAFPIEITGSAAVYNSARLHRFKHVIPAGTTWTHVQGVLVDAQQDGTVA